MKPRTAALVTVEPAPLEVMTGDPMFDRARQLWKAVIASSEKSHQDKFEMGRELLEIKTRKGLNVPGPKTLPQVGAISNCTHGASNSPPKTWAVLTRTEIGCSHDTANRLITYYEAFTLLRDALGEDAAESNAWPPSVARLGKAEHKAIREAVNQLPSEKHKKCLMSVFAIEERKKLPHVLPGGDTSAFRLPGFLENPTAEFAAALLKSSFIEFEKAVKGIRRISNRGDDIELWLATAPKGAADPKNEMGTVAFHHLMAQRIPEAIADLDDIAARLARCREGKNATAKRARRNKQTKRL
jgi:hypothetical protein